mgnify:CR=1 FL=1
MIRVAIFDVDGCLTDSTILYLDGGIRGRVFNMRDGQGLTCLKQSQVSVWLVSGEMDSHLFDRAEKLGVAQLFGLPDKRRVLDETDIPSTEIAFMGDDVNDIPLLMMVGMPACPHNAHPDVLNCVLSLRGFVATKDGGRGAVREFCDYIIAENRREAAPEFHQEIRVLERVLHD